MTQSARQRQPGYWLLDTNLLLASASVARADMLTRSGLPLDVEPARINERAAEAAHAAAGGDMSDLALGLARAKALDVSARHPGRLVLGADQTLLCDGKSHHKPADHAAARRQLASLAGREHKLTSAYCLARAGVVVAAGAGSAMMRMRPLDGDSLDRYLTVAGDAALTSVGCYQLEGIGSQLFDSIEGDHFTVLGLPLLKVLASLRQLGALAE